MSMTDIPAPSREESVPISGPGWFMVRRGWSDVLRCLFGWHRTSDFGVISSVLVRRCSCGAIQMGGSGLWVEGHPFTRRDGT